MSDEKKATDEPVAEDLHQEPSTVPQAVAGALDPSRLPPALQEKKIEILPCPCGKPAGKLRLELVGNGAKLGQARGNCCGTWAVEFINNTEDPQQSFEKAVAAWNAAPRAV